MGENVQLHLASIGDEPTNAELVLHLQASGVASQFPILTHADRDAASTFLRKLGDG